MKFSNKQRTKKASVAQKHNPLIASFRSLTKMLSATVVAMLVVGCASNGDIAELQSQVDLLKTSTASQIEASTVKAGAMCIEHCDKGMNNKLDIMFNKTMAK